MANKLTPKQESFARKYVECGNASEAYRHAYDAKNSKSETVWQNASRTLADSKVTARVMELQQAAQERTLVTVEGLTKELDEDRELARDKEQASAAIAAVMAKAKLNGLVVDKTENTNKNETALSDAELAAIATAGRAGASKKTQSPREPGPVH